MRRNFESSLVHSQLYKLLLLIGYSAVVVAILSAYSSPAVNYEISIYTETVAAFWIGTGIALVISVVISVRAYNHRLGSGALLLAVLSALSIFALPIIRGYFFYGRGDPLTHLGWVKWIADSTMSPTDLLYPGAHIVSLFLSNVGGIDVRHSMLLVTVLFKLVFILFIPLSLILLYRNRKMLFIGAYSAILLLPINNLGTHEHFHVSSLTILLSPVIFYLVFKHMTYYDGYDKLPYNITPISFLSLPALAALVFFHPQVALMIIVMFGGIIVSQITLRWSSSHHYMHQFRGIYGQFVFLSIIFVLWATQFGQIFLVTEHIITGIEDLVTGTEDVSPEVQGQGESAEGVGESVLVLFLKLFGVAALYTLLSGFLVLRQFIKTPQEQTEKTDGIVLHVTTGGVVLLPLVVLHAFGLASMFLFRVVGFGMVIITVLGAIELFRISETSILDTLGVLKHPVLSIGTIVILAAALIVVFGSPYVVLENDHVTETEFRGYETAFEQRHPAVEIIGIRASPGRFVDAHQYSRGEIQLGVAPTETEFEEPLPQVYQSDQFLAVSQADRTREVEVFREIRYSDSGFAQLETTPAVHRVQTNGDLDMYYIET